jgi:surfactin synthase thioesterase subunit
LSTTKSKWFLYATENAGAKTNFICFPHAGAGPGVYAMWGKIISKNFNFYPIHYPMREKRPSEPLPDTIQDLAYAIASENSDLFSQRPFVLYGHCVGGIIAYETAKVIKELYFVEPLLLVASSSLSPDCQLPEIIDESMDIRKVAETFAEMGYVSKDLIGNEMLLNYFLPVLKADYLLQQKYIDHDYEQLGCPILVMYGEGDRQLDADLMKKWEAYTTSGITCKGFPGSHFFADKVTLPGILQMIDAMVHKS